MAYENPQPPGDPTPEPDPPTEVVVSRRGGPGDPAPDPSDGGEEVRVYDNPEPVPLRREEVRVYNGVNPPPDYAYSARLERLRRERRAQQLNAVGKTIDAIWLLVGILEALLAMRFLFQIAGAHLTSGFIQFLYGVTDPFVLPFEGIFTVGRYGAYIFDPNILVGMVIWALLGLLVARLLTFAVEPQGRI
jgi:hypothetical protein